LLKLVEGPVPEKAGNTDLVVVKGLQWALYGKFNPGFFNVDIQNLIQMNLTALFRKMTPFLQKISILKADTRNLTPET